jgi:hypothetical protein
VRFARPKDGKRSRNPPLLSLCASADKFGAGQVAQLRCQYPQKSTLGLFRIANATTRSTWAPFGSFR